MRLGTVFAIAPLPLFPPPFCFPVISLSALHPSEILYIFGIASPGSHHSLIIGGLSVAPLYELTVPQ